MNTISASRGSRLSVDRDPVYELVGLTEGGLAIREGAPDGPIVVLDLADATALCGFNVDEVIEPGVEIARVGHEVGERTALVCGAALRAPS